MDRVKKRKKLKRNPEEVVSQFKRAIESLNTNIAIYENDITRSLQKMKDKFGITSIDEAINQIEVLDRELSMKEEELEKVIQKISVAMETYGG